MRYLTLQVQDEPFDAIGEDGDLVDTPLFHLEFQYFKHIVLSYKVRLIGEFAVLRPEDPTVVVGFGPVRDHNCPISDLKECGSILADDCTQEGAGEFAGAQFSDFCPITDFSANPGQPVLDELFRDPIKTQVGGCLAKLSEEPVDGEGCPIEGLRGTTGSVTHDREQHM